MTINLKTPEEYLRKFAANVHPLDRFSIEIEPQYIAMVLKQALTAEVMARKDNFTADGDVMSQVRTVAQWLSDPNEKPSLLLMGYTGNGKTTMARAIGRMIEALTEEENGRQARKRLNLYTTKEIISMMRHKYALYEELALFDGILVIDDLGAEPKDLTHYGSPCTPIEDLISKRYDRRLMTIITTNATAHELSTHYGERMYDRLKGMCKTITYENDSFRK